MFRLEILSHYIFIVSKVSFILFIIFYSVYNSLIFLVAESKARADLETATKLFMDQESQANITYTNNKRRIWAAFTNQMEILYDY